MFDITAITATPLYNLHTHTQFCDGHAPMNQFVDAAIELGFTTLGFSPHSPINTESTCNMTTESVAEYLNEIQRLRSLSGPRLRILAGMEIDFTGEQGPADGYFRRLPLDYRIGSIHFIPSLTEPETLVDIDGRFENFEKKMARYFDGDIEWVVRTYFARAVEMLSRGGFDIVGHCDKIALNAGLYRAGIDSEPWFTTLVNDLLDAALDYGYIIEINTKAYERHHRFFPDERYFARLRRQQARLVVNSDAHDPNLLNASRQIALDLLA